MNSDRSDDELIAAAIDSDRHAFGELFDRHSRAVYLYIWGMTGNARDAEDLTQDVFETAWRKLGGLRIVGASVLPWLLVTAKFSVRNDDRRRSHRRTDVLDDAVIDPRTSPDQRSSVEEMNWVRLEIAKLSSTDQKICNLCLIEGYTYKEAERAVGLSSSAIAKRVERLRIHLRAAVRSGS